MSDTTLFACPKCGHQTLVPFSEVKTYEDLVPFPCQNCGRLFTDNDVRSQSGEIAEKLLRDAIGKLKF
jgi:predicted RNA-binding Zn-ribbon protein involved in translation (DUF1610 family)